MRSYIKILSQYFILNLAAMSLLGNYTSMAMGPAEEEKKQSHVYQTPVKYQQQMPKIDETPGEKIIQKQRNLFDREKFFQIFTQEKVQELDNRIKWEVFKKADLPFDDPFRRTALRSIRDFLRENQSQNGEAKSLYFEMLALEDETKNVHQERIKNVAKQYFMELFPSASIEFKLKTGGDQLGTRVIVNSITYHTKTHSLGLQSQNSSAAKPFDPKELLTYKILEGFNIGCESHFFGRDANNFYIATKDAGAEGVFFTYNDLKSNDSKLKLILGNLQSVKEDESIKPDEQAQSFIEGMMCLDLLSRLLRLTDLQTNTGNFGFVKSKDIFKIKALDFRISGDINFKINEDHFQGFLKGNGLFNYLLSEPYMRYVLKERSEEKRVEIAQYIFKTIFFENKVVLESAYDKTSKTIEDIFQNDQESIDLKKELLNDLDQYTEAINYNFQFFDQNLKKFPQM